MTARKPSWWGLMGVIVTALFEHGALAQAVSSSSPPETAGMSHERLAQISRVMKEQIDKGVFPGAVTLVARRGVVVHFEAHGFLDAR